MTQAPSSTPPPRSCASFGKATLTITASAACIAVAIIRLQVANSRARRAGSPPSILTGVSACSEILTTRTSSGKRREGQRRTKIRFISSIPIYHIFTVADLDYSRTPLPIGTRSGCEGGFGESADDVGHPGRPLGAAEYR